MKGRSWIWLMTTAALLAGCHHESDPNPDRADAFAVEPAVHPSQQVMVAQAASGAREDGTLHAVHFDGTELNSLGRQKLGLMVRDEDASGTLVIYLDLPQGAQAPQARHSVVEFLKSQGLGEAQVRFQDGPNPAVTTPAAQSIDDLHHLSEDKKDQPADTGGYGPPPSSTGNANKDMTNH